YNKDMQEDKQAIFDSFDATSSCLDVATIVLRNIELREERMREDASRGMMNATELADYLVRKGMPFREAHETVGKIVIRGIQIGKELEQLTIEELQEFSVLIQRDVYEALSLDSTLNSKAQIGGTARDAVYAALAAARRVATDNTD